jgi:ParB family chromosome partitioning protein
VLDPVARERFLNGSTIEDASGSVAPDTTKKRKGGLVGDLDDLSEALKRHPWTALAALKGDPAVLGKLEETEKRLPDLKRALQ